ncbi:glycosyltransferase family protein [Acinetobacter haemolyticus]|uniref:Glycosyltransferase subfamily 4-like N-terminal domain-containing protein n=1 Tax=Acinetobacter haemolyticus TaxID=29430 RepID=A0A4P7B7J5_ACIHA|nr:hypothetical protein [Acinetobacter haemolyticus]QBQ17595.1 hypothetical protein AHTJR_15575 [Acinetobacter haemolyticus]
MKILIIAHDVAPLDLISSQRINHFIDFFSEKGYQIDVLTSKKREIDGPLKDFHKYKELQRKANFIEIPSTLSKNDVIITQEKTNISVNKINKKRELLKKVKAVLVKFTGQLLDYRTIWAYNSIKYLKNNKFQYDVVITSSLPPCVNWLGWYIKGQSENTLWIADFRDLWTLNHLVEYNFFSKRIDTFFEKKFLLKADLISTVSNDLSEKMKAFHKKEVLVVRNGFIPSEFSSISSNSDFFQDENKIHVVYAGNIYKGRRDPTELLLLINKSNLANKVHLHFFGHYLANLEEIVKENNAEDYCSFHSPLPRNQMLSVLKASDFNLFLESNEADAKGVMPGKIFELIALGNPILTIGPKDDFESVQLIKSSGLWIDLTDFIKKLKNNETCLSDIKDQSFLEKIAGRDEQVNRIHQYIEQKNLGKMGI